MPNVPVPGHPAPWWPLDGPLAAGSDRRSGSLRVLWQAPAPLSTALPWRVDRGDSQGTDRITPLLGTMRSSLNRRRIPYLILSIATALGAMSCRSTEIAYQFNPSPLEVLVTQSADEPVLARVLIGIPGAEREGRETSGRPELLVRMRIENRSENDISFDPSRSTLLGSDLAPFGTAKPEPGGIATIPAGRTESLLVRYPFPQDGSLKAPLLTGVNLRFELDLEGRPPGLDAVEVSATLERIDQQYTGNGRNTIFWDTGWRGTWGPGFGNRIGFGYGPGAFYGCW